MCFDLYVHNTVREHDTRHLSIINPVTGYTVYSPWQDPQMSPPCDYPHILDPIPPRESCPFHPRCCRLQRHFVCRFRDGSCQTQVKYHHFVEETNDETKDTSFLSAYFGYNPSLLLIAAWLFKSGVELAIADKHRSQISQLLAEMAESDNSQGCKAIDSVQQAKLEARYARLTYIITCSREVIGQFATLWDLNTGPGALPPRPGSHPNPESNEPLSRRLNLRTDRWVKVDDGKFSWPRLIQLWPNFEAGFLPIGDNPSVVLWNEMGGSRRDFDPIYNTISLTQGQQNTDVVFNSGTPDIPPIPPFPPFPDTIEESLSIKDCITVANISTSLTSSPLSSPPPSDIDSESDSD
ncbi:uncharacterized protein GGS22DRAFT_198418 [Annulohypoxylon maeteangense]|uniref:uncharacterized protein n=1 Tax=Annulohypoxylon maeteangense TaxID=1927788 RepID=UPI00200763EB|nr:uncharacterized protein GGS22DRAFT_198418 [Annulohypoxylon maeteangense]KAI0880003.1 hypothetical protein GGS22DRAFT_198418 [Annulohypoxylon maeteangense]